MGHGALDPFLGIEEPFHKCGLLVDQGCHQFRGIDPPVTHFHKMDMPIFKAERVSCASLLIFPTVLMA